MNQYQRLCALPEPRRQVTCNVLAEVFVIADNSEAWTALVMSLDTAERPAPNAVSASALVHQVRWGSLNEKRAFARTFVEALVEHGDNVAGALLLDAYVLARRAVEERHPVWDELTGCQPHPRKPT
ncbi:hypothetical protein GCM10027403_14820 [Arthrobacter tecti]